jgi:hypothetical protein
MKQAYPLQWPVGYKRTIHRVESKFKQTMERAQLELQNEVKRLGGKNLVVSTDLKYRPDGLLYADQIKRKVVDPGVAIYFRYKDKEISMCCDKYQTIWENIYALAMGIYALRGMERWGVSDFLDRAFSGFAALPEKASAPAWYNVLELSENASADQIKERYRELIKKHHPDVGGSAEKFIQVKLAYEDAMKKFQPA